MGTVEKRGKGSWRIGFQVPGQDGYIWIRQTVHVDPDLPEAEQRKIAQNELAALESRIRRQPDNAPQPELNYTVRSWSQVWLEEHVRPNCTPVTYDGYVNLLNSRILPLIGDVPLTQLTPMLLTQWLNDVRVSPRRSTRLPDDQLAEGKRYPSRVPASDHMDAPLSPKTLVNYYGCMDAMLSVAVRLDVLADNPMRKVQRPRVRRKKVNALSEERAVELLRCLKDEKNMCYRTAVLLALFCGLRLGEVCALKLSDVDWTRGTIDISRALKYTRTSGSFVGQTKTAAADRVITLPAGLMTVLHETREYQEECKRLAPGVWKDEGWIVHGWDGGRMHHDTPSRWFRKFRDQHGFEGVRFHDLRHTHATILLANNIDVVAVASRMGHSDASTTLRVYAHALERRDRDAALTFDRLFGALDLPGPPELRIEGPDPDPEE